MCKANTSRTKINAHFYVCTLENTIVLKHAFVGRKSAAEPGRRQLTAVAGASTYGDDLWPLCQAFEQQPGQTVCKSWCGFV